MAEKIQIDPAHPVGSLTAGAQQFTVVGDTNHKKESIHATLNDHIPVMAANGVKKIMIEYDVIALKDLEKKYPDLASARTAQDRAAVLEAIKAKQDAIISAETDRETAGLKMFGTPQEREEWSKAFGKGYERAVGIIGQSNIDELRRAQDSLATHAFLEKVYSKPPGLTDDEIRKSRSITSLLMPRRQRTKKLLRITLLTFSSDRATTASALSSAATMTAKLPRPSLRLN